MEGARLAAQARAVLGIEQTGAEEPLCPQPEPMSFEEAVELDHVLVDLESLTFVVRGVIDRLCERLSCRALAAAALTLRLSLDPKGIHEIDLPLRIPTRDVATLTTLCRLAVAATPPDREIVGVSMTARAAPPATDQLALFEPVPPRPEAIAATLARLAAVVGSDRAGSPEIQDSHRPEAWRLVPFAPPRARDQARPRTAPPSLDRFQLVSTAKEKGRGAQADDRAANRASEASAAATEFVQPRRSRARFGTPLAGEVKRSEAMCRRSEAGVAKPKGRRGEEPHVEGRTEAEVLRFDNVGGRRRPLCSDSTEGEAMRAAPPNDDEARAVVGETSGFRSTERGAALALRWLAETEEIDPLRRAGGTNVVEHTGPWRLEVEWWGPSAGANGARDYYAVRTSDGILHLVFKQGEIWRRAGVFD
jgi:hypothetical protein